MSEAAGNILQKYIIFAAGAGERYGKVLMRKDDPSVNRIKVCFVVDEGDNRINRMRNRLARLQVLILFHKKINTIFIFNIESKINYYHLKLISCKILKFLKKNKIKRRIIRKETVNSSFHSMARRRVSSFADCGHRNGMEWARGTRKKKKT